MTRVYSRGEMVKIPTVTRFSGGTRGYVKSIREGWVLGGPTRICGVSHYTVQRIAETESGQFPDSSRLYQASQLMPLGRIYTPMSQIPIKTCPECDLDEMIFMARITSVPGVGRCWRYDPNETSRVSRMWQ